MIGSLLAVSLSIGGSVRPLAVIGADADAADADAAATLTAYLDGKAIPLADVSRYYCDDFSYPVIRCSTSQLLADTRAALSSLLTSVAYVTIYEQAYYGGGWMNVSQDYNALVLMGWNDKISSFKARNGETGAFFTDWLYSGSQWSFCCNQQLTSLGAYDNTFSSILRT